MPSIALRRTPRRPVSTLLGALGLAGVVLGCDTIEPVAPTAGPMTDPAQLYMRLELNHPAVNLSTIPGYNTVQLTATPRDALGNAMTGLPAPTFHSSDTTTVMVTPDGTLTALRAGTGLRVVVKLTHGLVTHEDTVHVDVRTVAPQLASLSIAPASSDTAIWPVWFGTSGISQLGGNLMFEARLVPTASSLRVLAARAVDAAQNEIVGLTIEYGSLDPTIVRVNRWDGIAVTIRPGQARLVARTFAYGAAKADTVTFTITPPTYPDVAIMPGGFVPNEIRIAPYGLVFWQNLVEDSVDIAFDEPLPPMITPPSGVCDIVGFLIGSVGPGPTCDVGNILAPPFQDGAIPDLGLPWLYMTVQVRQFPDPGVYTYRSTRTGHTGRIVVTNNPE